MMIEEKYSKSRKYQATRKQNTSTLKDVEAIISSQERKPSIGNQNPLDNERTFVKVH